MQSTTKPMETTPNYYGLSSKIQLKELDNNRVGIYKVIKSRIIQKDALKIAAIAAQIKSVDPALDVTRICNRNICSKSIAWVEREGVNLKIVD